MAKSRDKYLDLIIKIYDRKSSDIKVAARWLAIEALHELNIKREMSDDAYILAQESLTRRAEETLRRKCGYETDTIGDQHELWPHLQQRYPVKSGRGKAPVYVLLEYLTDDELIFNEERLRKEGSAKIAHADALAAHRLVRIKTLFDVA